MEHVVLHVPHLNREVRMQLTQRCRKILWTAASVAVGINSLSLSATRTWSGLGAVPKAFSDPANWIGGVPSASDFALFRISDTVRFTSNSVTGEVSQGAGTIFAEESSPDTIWSISGVGGGF